MEKRKLAIVIDDELSVRDLLDDILTSLGYETKVFRSPMDIPCIMESELHDCIFETIPELLIVNINMPDINGIEFVVQNIQKQCKIKNIALMSGFWTDGYRELAEKLNCKQIDKPVTFYDIKEWVNSVTNT